MLQRMEFLDDERNALDLSTAPLRCYAGSTSRRRQVVGAQPVNSRQSRTRCAWSAYPAAADTRAHD